MTLAVPVETFNEERKDYLVSLHASNGTTRQGVPA